MYRQDLKNLTGAGMSMPVRPLTSPLPGPLQMPTIYAAAIATHAQNAMDAAALLDDLRGPKGREANLKAGLQPVSQ